MSETLDRLERTPVTKLDIGDTRFRRELATLGCSNIIEVLKLPLKTVDRKLSLDANDLLDKLRDKYEKDPESFAKQVLPAPKDDPPAAAFAGFSQAGSPDVRDLGHVSGPVTVNHVSSHTRVAVQPAAERPRAPFSLRTTLVATPEDDWFKELRELNARAGEVFDDLDDRFDTVMVHMAFEALATSLDAMRGDFRALFAYYRGRHGDALVLIDTYLRNIYLVFIADRARELYDGAGLWINVFNELGVVNNRIQGDLKKIFVAQLERRNMPRYAVGESDFYYLYTALMHGGLSEDLWADLWKKSVRPFCRKLLKSSTYTSYETVALELLDEIKNPDSCYAPNNSVRKILEKVPSASVASLFVSALDVAAQVDGPTTVGSGLQMLSSHGLPDAAMVALRNQLGKGASRRDGRVSRGSLIYFPEAELSLDIDSGSVLIAWPELALPSDLGGGVVEYVINGELVHSEPVRYSVNRCVLPAVKIPVTPCAKYSVELRMGGEALPGSLRQSIHRSRPGCFEFVETRRGTYRLRGAKERLTKTRKIAYLVEESLEVVPGHGMIPGAVYETDDSWGEARVQVFTVEPGASGSIIESVTGREVAVWHESYRVHVSKDRRIGRTMEGLDLYGQSPDLDGFDGESPDLAGFDGGLPIITVTGVNGEDVFKDLKVECFCDGKWVSIARRKRTLQREDGVKEVTVCLDLAGSFFPSRFVQNCEIAVRQVSASDSLIYRYRFAMAPIGGFHIESMSISDGVLLARYCFKSAYAVDISMGDGGKQRVNALDDYAATVPLSDEILPLLIEAAEDEVLTSINALVDLAAIDVRLPEQLVVLSGQRPICLYDALELGPSAARITLYASGWRVGRVALVMLDSHLLLYKPMDAPGRYEINLFENPEMFLPGPNGAGRFPLTLSLWFGSRHEGLTTQRAYVDVELLDCSEGLGFNGVERYTDANFRCWLRFDSPALCDCVVRFTGRHADKEYGEVELPCGETKVEVPPAAVRALASRRKVRACVLKTDIFGDVDDRYPIEISLER